jgi:hypothetical protein
VCLAICQVHDTAPSTSPPPLGTHTHFDISALPHLTPVTFLSACPPLGGLCQGDVLKESLRRYEKLWLPLVAQQQAVAGGPQGYSHLVPPLDIALLWHLHRLQPEVYAADCRCA